MLLLASAVLVWGEDPVWEGEGIEVVEAPLPESPPPVADRQDLEAVGAQDVAEALERTRGAVILRNGGYGSQASVELRGFGSGRVAVLLDGVPVNSAQTGGFDLGSLGLSGIDRLEVFPGGGQTRYAVPGAVGGVINLVTVPPASEGWSLGASVSNLTAYPSAAGWSPFDTQGAQIRGTLGGPGWTWAWGGEGHLAKNEFSYLDEQGRAKLWSGNGVVDGGLGTSWEFDPAPGQKWVLATHATLAQRHVPGSQGSDASAAGLQTDGASRTSLRWSAGTLWSDNLSADVTAGHQYSGLEWVDGSGTTRHFLQTWSLNGQFTWTGVPSLALTLGTDGTLSNLRSDALGDRRAVQGGISAAADWDWGTAFRVSPSLSLVGTDDLGIPLAIPKLHWAAQIAPRLLVENSWFRAFRYPSLNDKFWPADGTARGNPGLKPEDGVGTDLSVSGTLAGGWSWGLSGYATTYSDAILWEPSGPVWTPVNLGKAQYLGTDATVGLHASDLRVSVRYAFLMTWVLTDGLTWADNKRMPYTPVHSGGFLVEWSPGAGTLSASGHLEGPRYVTPLNLYALEPFFTLDAGWQQPLAGGVSLFVDGKNLLNASYTSVQGYPMPGGSVTVGLKASWGGKPPGDRRE
jgi:vitamin B12 transporter